MTSKEKAKQLVNKMFNCDKSTPKESMAMLYPHAKQCALIAVEEILEMDLPILEEDADGFYDYWEQVKHEIEKL